MIWVFVVVLITVAAHAVLADKFIDVRPPKTTSSEAPMHPWIRTVSGEVELVTPTVIDGITFSASPRPAKTPTPWVSLKKDGVAKTISPKVKGGETKNPWPDYDTWFDTQVTVTHDLSSKKVKGGSKKEKHVEVKLVPEDEAKARLNPLIRCTPDRYFTRRGKKRNSAPFCTPQQNTDVLYDQVHWVSWFTRHFRTDEKVRLHMAYVEDRHRKIEKRSTGDPATEDLELQKRSGGGVKAAFFSTEWLDNTGFFPLEIEKEWLLGKYNQLTVLSLQPDSVANDEFDMLTNGTVVRIRQGPTVIKDSTKKKKEDPEKLELKQSDDRLTMALLSIPTILLIFLCFYMWFVWATRHQRSFNVHDPRRHKRQVRRKDGRRYENIENAYEMT